jgi:RNA-directed DNA polymerase
VMAELTRFLAGRLRLQVNRSPSMVDRPWHGTGLGDTVTHHRRPRWKPAPRSITRATERRCQITPQGRGLHSRTVSTAINRVTRGGVGYVRRSTVQHPCVGLDQWMRRS